MCCEEYVYHDVKQNVLWALVKLLQGRSSRQRFRCDCSRGQHEALTTGRRSRARSDHCGLGDWICCCQIPLRCLGQFCKQERELNYIQKQTTAGNEQINHIRGSHFRLRFQFSVFFRPRGENQTLKMIRSVRKWPTWRVCPCLASPRSTERSKEWATPPYINISPLLTPVNFVPIHANAPPTQTLNDFHD